MKVIAWIISIPLLALWLYVGYWKYIHEPIDEVGFARGVSVGMALQQCGVNPSPKMIESLSHFVNDDMSTHDCLILQAEVASSKPARSTQEN